MMPSASDPLFIPPGTYVLTKPIDLTAPNWEGKLRSALRPVEPPAGVFSMLLLLLGLSADAVPAVAVVFLLCLALNIGVIALGAWLALAMAGLTS
ncbi:MAG: hypothetical protein U1E43_08365 [Rhodospirillales bacterium]